MTTSDSTTHDLRDDAQRYLVDALRVVADRWVAEHPRPPKPVEPEGDEENYDDLYAEFEDLRDAYDNWYDPPWVELNELVENYDPPRPNNLAEIRKEVCVPGPSNATNADAKEDLIAGAHHSVNVQNGGQRRRDDGVFNMAEVVVEFDSDRCAFPPEGGRRYRLAEAGR